MLETNNLMDGWMASHRSVILVQLPDDSSLAGMGVVTVLLVSRRRLLF